MSLFRSHLLFPLSSSNASSFRTPPTTNNHRNIMIKVRRIRLPRRMDGKSQNHPRTRHPLLRKPHRTRAEGGEGRHHRRPRQLPPRPGETPGQYWRGCHRRAEHPHGNSAGVRAGRRFETHPAGGGVRAVERTVFGGSGCHSGSY